MLSLFLQVATTELIIVILTKSHYSFNLANCYKINQLYYITYNIFFSSLLYVC